MANKDRTLYCGNLSDKVTEDLLYELFLQAGPLESVKIPKEKDGRQKNFGFITFKHPVSVPYSIALMNGIALFGKNLRLDARSGSESVPNPYLEQLRQYQQSVSRQSYHQNDNRMHGNSRGRQHDSRRYETRTENDMVQFNARNVNPAMQGLYAGYNQPYMLPQNIPQGYPMNYGQYSNQWNQFR